VRLPKGNLHDASRTRIVGMAGYRDGLAGEVLRTILIKNIGIVNAMRIIVICCVAGSLHATVPISRLQVSQPVASQPFSPSESGTSVGSSLP
jgi:hypothetical protein